MFFPGHSSCGVGVAFCVYFPELKSVLYRSELLLQTIFQIGLIPREVHCVTFAVHRGGTVRVMVLILLMG